MKIQYSTANNHPADAPELTNGLNLPANSYSIFADVAGTWDLYYNGARYSTFFPHAENGSPFDLFGSNGTNANMLSFKSGNWGVFFTPKVGAAVQINFTVGTVTPPPTNEPILEEYINPTELTYNVRTASGTYKSPVTKI